MAAKVPDTTLECPVCHEDFQEPKILPCTHLVCQKCVLSWITKEGSEGGCPLCRHSIISSTQSSHVDLASLVDALPTDLTIQALVANQKVLNSQEVCGLCDDDVAASAYCLQCSIKLCRPCTKSHKKIPTLKSHVVEDLDDLTAQRLAQICRLTCKSHTDRLAELYCTSHQELICMICFPTNHRDCPEVKAVVDVATQKRVELKEKAAKLLEEEAKLSSQIQNFRDEFKANRKKVSDVFDDLELSLHDRRQEINDKLQAEEDAGIASLSRLEKARAALKAHADTVKNLADSAADDVLLGMLGKLTSRLQDVEQLTETVDLQQPVVEVSFDDQELKRLEDSISCLGQITKPALASSACPNVTSATPGGSTTTTATSPGPAAAQAGLTGKELAEVLKTGHRVKRGPGWRRGNVDRGGPGTVVAFPAYVPPTFRCFSNFTGNYARVKWDKTQESHVHRMGEGFYELELM